MKQTRYGSYDETNKYSIYQHAQLLLDKTLEELYKEDIQNLPRDIYTKKGKGNLGLLVERLHFNYGNNQKSEADFPKASLELKTTPLKIVRQNQYVSKERLVLGMIDYSAIVSETFESSLFVKKNLSLLVLFYLYSKDDLIKQVFKIIKLWDITGKDFKIIRQDWEKIVQKIKEGKAHEISGGDTLYLEAARKGAGKGRDLTKQPKSKKKANRRAFAFKSKYVNLIINEAKDIGSALDAQFIESKLTFEDYIISKFKPHLGKTITQIAQEFGVTYSDQKKDKASMIAKAILGISSKVKIAEFEKADIQMKTITLEKTGKLKESMSFKAIDYQSILKESWEESYFFNKVVNRKFFFVIFQKNEGGGVVLRKVLFWNMPPEMVRESKIFWLDTQKKINFGEMHNFWRISDKRFFHIRPKAKNAKDLTKLKDGAFVKKYAYWINREVIWDVVFQNHD